MTTISETYADLGGLTAPPATRSRWGSRDIDRSPGVVCAQHMFNPVSGWCGCGTRDDGKLAEGSPAWRAELERQMPAATA